MFRPFDSIRRDYQGYKTQRFPKRSRFIVRRLITQAGCTSAKECFSFICEYKISVTNSFHCPTYDTASLRDFLPATKFPTTDKVALTTLINTTSDKSENTHYYVAVYLISYSVLIISLVIWYAGSSQAYTSQPCGSRASVRSFGYDQKLLRWVQYYSDKVHVSGKICNIHCNNVILYRNSILYNYFFS